MSANVDIAQLLQTNDAVLVTIHSFEGSSPREVGAWMLVLAGDVHGTVGGGNLEFQAIAYARELLSAQASAQDNAQGTQRADELRRYPLGPSLGQCCGGVVHLKFVTLTAGSATNNVAVRAINTWTTSRNSLKIALFGGGHVGKALVNVLGLLPCAVHWIDSRDEIFPTDVPANTQCEHSAPVHAAVNDLAAGSHVLIMSFSHAEDLDVVAQCLLRLRAKNDLPFIGLIGSKTKWATFRHRLEDRGFSAAEIARITCPIGLDGVAGKEPEVIAVSVAAQLLRMRAGVDVRVTQ
jgi:xanthine dehydrogenase accessory factor